MALYLLFVSFLFSLPGVSAITDTDVGVIVAGVISGLILILLVVGVPVLVYIRKKKTNTGRKRQLPREHFVNGTGSKLEANGYHKPHQFRMPPQPHPRHPYTTPVGSHRGVPVIHVTPHGSHRGTPVGSMRGRMRGGSVRVVITPGGRHPMMYPMGPLGPRGPYPMGTRGRGAPYPGPYGYPDPMMYPYFFPPPFPPHMMFFDESDDDSDSGGERRSNRSTLRERKMRYHRSFIPDRQSKLVIKEIDSEEEQKMKEEENKKKKGRNRSKSRSRSRSPGERKRANTPQRSKSPARRRSRSPSPQRYKASTHHDIYTEVSKQSNRRSSLGSAGDTAAKIDEMFSFSSDASAKPGDIIFMPPGQHIDSTPRRRDPTPPRRDPTPPPRRDPSPIPIRAATPPRPESKPRVTDDTSDYTYASVIRPSAEPDYNRPSYSTTDIGVSMSERLQNIVESGHTSVLHDHERHVSDDIQYPPKGQSLSKTTREPSAQRNEYPSSYKRYSATSKPDLYDTNRPTSNSKDFRRPPTPPNDIPNTTPVPTPRQSLIKRPETPPNDIPMSSRSNRPSTPPFDGNDYSRRTSTPAVDRKVPPAPPLPPAQASVQPQTNQRNPSNLGSTQQARSAFSNLVLEELKERHRMPEVEKDDDDDSSRNRAVNFSASPPEIIPRSEPNSPRASQNLNPDVPPYERAPPPPPPPPPAPPLPK